MCITSILGCLDPQFDVIVIGSGIGGLVTAALLAKAGKKVLVLEQHYVAGGFTHTFTYSDRMADQAFTDDVSDETKIKNGSSSSFSSSSFAFQDDLFHRFTNKHLSTMFCNHRNDFSCKNGATCVGIIASVHVMRHHTYSYSYSYSGMFE